MGGGNSAGQAAVFLAGGCRHVHILVRSDGLADSMSRYLIRRIEESSNITCAYVARSSRSSEGTDRLERVSWRNAASDSVEMRKIEHVFLMTGAVPNTQWLQGCVALDDKGFVRTGPELLEDASGGHALAATACASLVGDEPARRFCCGRRALRQRQTHCVRSWRRFDLRTIRASRAAGTACILATKCRDNSRCQIAIRGLERER